MGKVIGIAAKETKESPSTVYASAKISFKNGVADDYRGEANKEHQISIITQESWDEVCKELNTKLHWTLSDANILVEGIDLNNTVGDYLKIGNFYLEITGENKPTDKYNDVFIGLKEALTSNLRGGVIAKVYSEGIITENDSITIMVKE